MAITSTVPAVDAASRRGPSPLARVLAVTAGLAVILVALLALFILPSLNGGPRDLPIGIVGDAAVAAQVEAGLEAGAEGAYAPEAFASEAELVDAIEAREVVGGLVVDGTGIRALVASAGSTAISGTLTGTAQALGAQLEAPVTVEDVVPLPADDPTGIGIGGLAFPLVFGGIVPAVAYRKIAGSFGWAVAGIVGFSAIAGVIVTSVLAFLFGSIDPAAFWPVAGALTLGIGALAIPLAGLQEVFGAKGFTIGAMAMMFLGNPLAGISTTAVWLPAFAGTVGQILPPGAAGTLVRSAAYFGGAGGTVAAVTLGIWVVAGAVLLVIGGRRTRVAATVEA